MTVLIVDASAAVKWFFEEDHTACALRLLDDRYSLHAPDFVLLEIDSVVSKRVRRSLISDRDGRAVRDAMRKMPIDRHRVELLSDPAFELSLVVGCALYDCLYLALGELLGGPVVTADRRLIGNAESAGLADRVVWVGDIG
jgi:predicted nucleic acid-binding protein